jgi:hypothetical protein
VSRRRVEDYQDGFAGGLNTTATESQLKANQFRRGDNIHLSDKGAATKRRGSRYTHASALGGGDEAYGVSFRTGTTQELVVCGGALYGGTYSFGMSWTELAAGGLSNSAVPRFAHFRDGSGEVMYIADGGLLNKTDGATLTANIASTPSVGVVEVYNQRLYGISGSDQTVYASAINNGDTLGVTGSGGIIAVVRTFGGQRLRALKNVGDSLLMFHTSAVSRFTGLTQDDVAIEAGSQGVSGVEGTIAPGSIVVVEIAGVDVALFLTSDGLLYSANSGGVSLVSDGIQATLSNLTVTEWDKVCAIHNKVRGEVWFYIPDTGAYIFNYGLKAWSGPFNAGFVDPAIRSMWTTVDTNSKQIILSGSADGFVRALDVKSLYLDNVASDGSGGENFAMALQLRRMYFRNESVTKAARRAWVLANLRGSASTSLRTRTLDGTTDKDVVRDAVASESIPWGTGTWGTGTWGGTTSNERPYEVPLSLKGPYFDFTLSDDAAKEVSIARVVVEAYSLGRR